MSRGESAGNNFKDLFGGSLKRAYNVSRFPGFLLLQSVTSVIQFILFIDDIFALPFDKSTS